MASPITLQIRGEILDFAPHREGESGALIGGGGCQEGPEIAVDLSLDLLFDGLDRGQNLHLGEVVVAIVGQQRLVVLGDGVELEHHQIGIVFTHGIQAVLHQRGGHGIVGIGEVYVRTGGPGDAGVAGVGQAAVGLVNHAYARVAGGPGVAHGRAIVGRAVVDQQNLQIGVRLRGNRRHAFVEELLDLIYRNNDADQRILFHISSVTPPHERGWNPADIRDIRIRCLEKT